jgi:hypothetical protein
MIYIFIIILSIYKSRGWIYFFHRMVIEIVLNNEIEFFFQNKSIKRKIYVCVHYWKTLSLNFNVVNLEKIIIKYQNSKMIFCVMF